MEYTKLDEQMRKYQKAYEKMQKELILLKFANFLKDYAKQVKENGYDGIGENDIDEKLKEFLENDY